MKKKQKHDFDSPWKDVLHRYFEEFIAFFLPEAHADIDWEKGYEFLDKEFQKIVRDAELGRRLLDKLVKVQRKDGREAWVLVHIEIQGQEDEDLAKRIYTYNYRIFDRYDRPVASLVVLADDRIDWRPHAFDYNLWGTEAGLRFPAVKLKDLEADWKALEQAPNPFSVIVMAHLKTTATRNDPASRLNWKLHLVKMLYERGFSRKDILELFRFIDWVMILPEDLEAHFSDALVEYEEEMKMPYVTSVERVGRERGRNEGLQGSREALIGIMEARFGWTPAPSIAELINEINDLSVLKTLLIKAATATSPDDFKLSLEKMEKAVKS
jgi:hypothetical protein